METPNNVVFFDGVCVFCNGSVQLLIKIDRRRALKYSTLQGTLAGRVLKPQDTESLSGVVFLTDGQIFKKSQAIVQILKTQSGFYSFLGQFLNLFPSGFLNIFYDLFAKYRYRLFGKQDSCSLPKADEKELFIP